MMKDSGIEWVGQIPSSWEIIQSKYCFDAHKRIVGTRQDSYDRLALTMQGVVKRSKEDVNGLQPDSFYTYQILEQGELVFKLIDLQNIHTSRVGLSPYTGIVSPAYIILSPKSMIYPLYAEKYFMSLWQMQVFNHLGDEGVRSSLSVTDLLDIPFVCPPYETQKVIAGYLNEKCVAISSIIADYEAEIQLLEQYKQSLIIEAVSRGLLGNGLVKNAGIEWIGNIPDSWNVNPLYCYFEERKKLNKTGQEKNLLSLSYGKIIRKDINTNEGLLPASFNTYNIVESGDIIIRPTDLQNDKHSLRTGLVKEHGIITSAYIALKAIKPINSDYYQYLLYAYDVMKVFYNMGNGVRQGLNFSELSRLKLLEPPREEQNQIVKYLDGRCSEIDSIIDDKEHQIDILNEYNKSMIYEYITGKREVPLA